MDIGGKAKTELHVKVDPRGAEQGIKRVNRSLDTMRGRANQATKATSNLTKALTYIGVGFLASQVARYADSWTEATNKLRVYTKTAGELKATQKALFDISQRTRNEFASTVGLYNKLLISQKSIGASSKELLLFTEGVGQAIKLSGANAQTASGSLLQLGQALSTGRVYAEEMNSILEGTPRLAIAIASGIEQAEDNVGRLKILIKDGVLTSQDLFASIMTQLPVLAKEYEKLTPTITDAWTRMGNAITKYIGTNDQGIGASAALSNSISFLADNITLVADTAIIALGSTLAYYAALKLGAVAAATQRMIALQIATGSANTATALFTLTLKRLTGVVRLFTVAIATNPLGALIVALSATIGYLAIFADEIKPVAGSIATLGDYASVAFSYIADSIKYVGNLISGYFGGVFEKSKNVITQYFYVFNTGFTAVKYGIKALFTGYKNLLIGFIATISGAKAAIVAAWKSLPLALVDIAIRAMNGVIKFINVGVNKVIEILNNLPGVEIQVNDYQLNKFNNDFENASKSTAETMQQAYTTTFNNVTKEANQFTDNFVAGTKRIKDGVLGIGTAWQQAANKRALANKVPSEEGLTGQVKDYGKIHRATGKDGKNGSKKPKLTFDEYLQDMNKEIDLLKLGYQQRELVRAQISAENDLKKEGIKLTNERKKELKQIVKLKHYHEKGAKATKQFLSSQEKVNNSVSEYNTLREMNIISEETYQRALQDTYQKYELIAGNIDSLKAKISQQMQSWGNTLTDTLADAAIKGELSFKRLADSIIRDLVRMGIQARITAPLLQMGMGFFGGLGSASPAPAAPNTGPPSTGFRARGGTVLPNKWYMVGEEGPELLKMGAANSGRVFSNTKSSQMLNDGNTQNQSVNVTVAPVYNIQGDGSSVTKEDLASLVSGLPSIVKQSVMDGISRGGTFKKVIASA